MRRLKNTENSILIEEEIKRLFSSKIIINKKEILLYDIKLISCDIYENKLNYLTIFKTDGTEEFLTLDEFENLENIYQFLLSKKKNNHYMMQSIDIETTQIKEI